MNVHVTRDTYFSSIMDTLLARVIRTMPGTPLIPRHILLVVAAWHTEEDIEYFGIALVPPELASSLNSGLVPSVNVRKSSQGLIPRASTAIRRMGSSRNRVVSTRA